MFIRELDFSPTDALPVSDEQRSTGVRGIRHIRTAHVLAPRAASYALCFSGADGMVWQVFEWIPSCEDDVSAAPSLIFLSDEKFRRVRDYPADWRTFDAPALELLSWHR